MTLLFVRAPDSAYSKPCAELFLKCLLILRLDLPLLPYKKGSCTSRGHRTVMEEIGAQMTLMYPGSLACKLGITTAHLVGLLENQQAPILKSA